MKQRIDHIDGLRGVAVLAVVLFHAGVHNSALVSAPGTVIGLVLRQGCHGVDLFFVLSGFCLAYPTLVRLHLKQRVEFSTAAYASRRLIRIIPPYYAAIAVLAAVCGILTAARIPLPDAMSTDALSASAIAKQMFFLDGSRVFLNSSFWTLAIEFRWYFVFPILLLMWTRTPKAFAAVAIAAIAGCATRLYSVDLFFLPFFMLGIVAAHVYVKQHRTARFAVPALALSLTLAVASGWSPGWYFQDSGPFWGIAAFWLVVLTGASPWLRTLLSGRWIVGIGAASYGIYLVHEPTVAIVERLAVPVVGAAAAFGIAICAAIAVGFCFSLAAERPFVSSRLRDRLLLHLETALPQIFVRFGIPASISLTRKSDDSSRDNPDFIHPVEIAV